MRRAPHDQPMLITTAPESSGDEFDRRRKKYAIMMGTRALCVLAAALTYHVSLILALALLVGGAVLPWCAVLIANDRPAKRRRAPLGYTAPTNERALPSGPTGTAAPDGDDRIVDG